MNIFTFDFLKYKLDTIFYQKPPSTLKIEAFLTIPKGHNKHKNKKTTHHCKIITF